MADTIDYRLVILDPDYEGGADVFSPGDLTISARHWYVTTVRGGVRPYIEGDEPPVGDGQEVDLITGKVTDGSYTVRVIDNQGTVGGGTGTNDELNDAALDTRWSRNYSGDFIGDPWGIGFIQYPAAGSSDMGVTLGGSHFFYTPGSEYFRSRVFTGLSPSTDYTVQLRYYNRGCASLLGYGLGAPADGPRPFLRSGFNEVVGSNVRPPLVTPPSNPGADILTLTVTSDGSGNLAVEFGVRQSVACAVFSWVLGFDWVRIAPGTPATTGRYVTLSLADPNARQQVLGRKAFLEQSFNRGASWPSVLQSGFVTDYRMQKSLVWDITIGDTRRVERNTKAFAQITQHFDNVTCLVGGPTKRGWQPFLPYYGWPTFVVESASSTLYDGGTNMPISQGEIILKYVSGPMPEAYRATGDNFTRANFDIINQRARRFWVPDAGVPEKVSPTNGQTLSAGSFPRLQVEIAASSVWAPTHAVATKFTPWSWYAFYYGQPPSHPQFRPYRDTLFGEGGRIRIPWDVPPSVALPVVGGLVQLAIYPLDISEDAPLHLADHPADIVANLYLDAGIPYDTNSVVDVKHALGDQLRYYGRITKPEPIQTFIERLFGLCDFATRVENGRRVFFTLRRKQFVSPGVSVVADTLREEGGPTFELSEATKVNQIRATQERYKFSVAQDASQRVWDDIEVSSPEIVADLVDAFLNNVGSNGPEAYQRNFIAPRLDAVRFGERTQGFDVPGQLWISSLVELTAAAYTRGVSERIFDRFGRGAPMSTAVTRRGAGADDLQVGDEATLDIPHHPNAQYLRSPSSQRGGSRRVTAVRWSEGPAGRTYQVTDAGTGTLPFDVAPLAGRWTADVDPNDATIVRLNLKPTGAEWLGHLCATYNARIIVKVVVGGPEPTLDQGIEYTIIDPRELLYDQGSPSEGRFLVPLGPFPANTPIWIRLQTFVPGGTPSGLSDWYQVGSGSSPTTGTITGLAAIAVVDAAITLGWTNTDAIQPVTIGMRMTSLGGAYAHVTSLQPGSDQFQVTGLTAGTSYDFEVTLPDGTSLTLTQATTSSGPVQLPTPQWPAVWSDGAGRFGLRVIATEAPATVVFELGVETAVGSGAPGAMVQYDRQAAVLNAYVSGDGIAPNDGKRRYLRAKLTWPGRTDSPYTSTLAVDPWSASSTPGNPPTIPPGTSPPVIPPGSGPGGPGGPIVPIVGRLIVQIAAMGVASAAEATGTVWVSRGSVAYRVRSNNPVRVRLYDTAAARTSDAGRAIDTDALSGSGLVLDVVLHPTDPDGLDKPLSPRVILGSVERTNTARSLYYSVTNLMGSTADLLVEIDLTPYET